jgi:3-isopropylmalate dehydrogenase
MTSADGTPRTPRPSVVVIGGDGIGPEVVAEAVGVLQAAGFPGAFVEAAAGWQAWQEGGVALPAATLDLVETHRVCLFGAITSQPEAVTSAESHGREPWRSPILELRQRFDLDVSVRPARSFPGVADRIGRRAADGTWVEPVVDLVVVRQNTEGLYAGIEWTDPPGAVLQALRSHPRWRFGGEDLAVGVRVVTRRATERAARAAFDLAQRRGASEVVLAEKPNVLRETSGLVLRVAAEVATRYPDVSLAPMNADAVLMEMVGRPERFGVILTTNLIGDLLSDAAAGLIGGPGFAPSANLGSDAAVFEPVHGSAPDIAGSGTANPIAAVLAGAMLAEHTGFGDVAEAIESAVERAVAKGLPEGTGAIGRAIRAAM